MSSEGTGPEAQHAIVEMMGHRVLVGRVEEGELYGMKCLVVITLTDPPRVQKVNPVSIYCLTACSEAEARRASHRNTLPHELTAASVVHHQLGAVDHAREADDEGPGVPCAECRAAAHDPCDRSCGLREFPDRHLRVPVGMGCVHCGAKGPEHHGDTCETVSPPSDKDIPF